MKKALLKILLLLPFLMLGLSGYAQTDAEFRQMMETYKEKLKHVRTRAEGMAILTEMQAKQQAYLKKKMQPVTDIKNQLGVDQATSALADMNTKTGNAKYENNPLYTKCKVEVIYSYRQNDRSNGGPGPGYATYKANGSASFKMTSYLFKYLGKIVLETPDDAIVNCTEGGMAAATGTDVNSEGKSSTYTDNAMALHTPSPRVGFNYESPTHWSASMKMLYKGTHSDPINGSVIDTPDVHPNATNENGTLTQVGDVITITRAISENSTTGSGDRLQTLSFSANLRIKISPAHDDYVAYLEPVKGQADYEQWMPEGYKSLIGKHGNYIDFKVKVESKSHAGQDFTNQISHIDWELPDDEVSRIPGYANNGPTENIKAYNNPSPKDTISKLADMQLHITTDQPDTSVENLKASCTLNNQYTIRVHSFDWGAYGKLTAHVFLIDGTEMLAKERGTGNEFVLLPKRDGKSKIATYFKTINQVNDREDTDDSERISADDQFAGDGFTLYEEYRGFIENGKHFRADPNAKDVMIYNGINTGRSRDGIATYEEAINSNPSRAVGKVKTHSRFTKDEFGIKLNDATASEMAGMNKSGAKVIYRTKCLNFNFLPDLHAVDQHGICILPTTRELNYAQAWTNIPQHNGPPKNFDFLFIGSTFKPAYTSWVTVKGTIDAQGDFHVDPYGTAVAKTDEYAITIAHEMFHNSGISHHGNHEYAGLDGVTFESKGDGTWLVNGTNIVKLFWEGAHPVQIFENDNAFKALKASYQNTLKVRMWRGTCSGVEDCIMRYDDAQVYCKSKTSTEMYVIAPGHGYKELTGIVLCNDDKGTGVNAETHVPMSRYSDAEDGLGKCFTQFCINDIYAQ